MAKLVRLGSPAEERELGVSDREGTRSSVAARLLESVRLGFARAHHPTIDMMRVVSFLSFSTAGSS